MLSFEIFRRGLLFSQCRNFSLKLLGCHNFRVSKSFMLQRVMSPFSVEIFCVTVSRKFVWEPFCAVFQKNSGSEKVYGKGGKSRFCVETFLPHSDEKCHKGTRQHFINFGYRKRLDERVEGGVENFPSKLSFLTVPEIFVRKTFRVSLLSGLEEFYASEGYVTSFSRNFLSHSAEKHCRGTLLCFVSENFR